MYAKVFVQMYDGTLCTKGPWQALVTFQQLLVLADQDGNVDMTADAIARRTTIPLEIIKTGLCVLAQPDDESRTPNEEGRRILPLSEGRAWGWNIVNYKHYRELKREEDRREYHREYWHKRNKINKKNVEFVEPQHAQQKLNHSTYAEAEAEAEAKSEDKNTREKKPKPSLSDGIDMEVWADFVKLRAAKKAPITVTAMTGIQREAHKAGVSLEDALRVCIERGWTGFKAEWHANAGGSPNTAQQGETAYQRNRRAFMTEHFPNIAAKPPLSIVPAAEFFELEQANIRRISQ